MSVLVEEFADSLDAINDALTDITIETFNGVGAIETLLSEINDVLNEQGMHLDFNDIETVISDWEEPTELDGINVVFPIYDSNNDVTIYNLSLTYALDDSESSLYIVDAEVQYEWELDDEIATEYVDLDD